MQKKGTKNHPLSTFIYKNYILQLYKKRKRFIYHGYPLSGFIPITKSFSSTRTGPLNVPTCFFQQTKLLMAPVVKLVVRTRAPITCESDRIPFTKASIKPGDESKLGVCVFLKCQIIIYILPLCLPSPTSCSTTATKSAFSRAPEKIY